MTSEQERGQTSYAVNRLKEALEIQDSTEGEHCKNPTVEYCFECDEITVDGLIPDECLDHPTVMSDGYEHGGIQAAITVLEYYGDGDDQ